MADATTGSIVIDANAEAVARVLADIAHYPSWTNGMSDIEILEIDGDRPLRARFSVSGGPIQDRVELVYTWTDADVSWTLAHGSAITGMTGRYAWQALGDRTQVTYELEISLAMSLPSFIKRAAEKTIVSTALEGLKKRVEAQS